MVQGQDSYQNINTLVDFRKGWALTERLCYSLWNIEEKRKVQPAEYRWAKIVRVAHLQLKRLSCSTVCDWGIIKHAGHIG